MQISGSYDKFMSSLDESPVKLKSNGKTDGKQLMGLFNEESNDKNVPNNINTNDTPISFQNSAKKSDKKNDTQRSFQKSDKKKIPEVKTSNPFINNLKQSNVTESVATPYLPNIRFQPNNNKLIDLSSVQYSEYTPESEIFDNFQKRKDDDLYKRRKNSLLQESTCQEIENGTCTFTPALNENSRKICEKKNFVPITKNWKESINKKEQWLNKQKEIQKTKKEFEEDIAMTNEKNIGLNIKKSPKKKADFGFYEKQRLWQEGKNRRLKQEVEKKRVDILQKEKNQSLPLKTSQINKSSAIENFLKRQERFVKSRNAHLSRESVSAYKDCTFRPNLCRPQRRTEPQTVDFSKSMTNLHNKRYQQTDKEVSHDFTHPKERINQDKQRFLKSNSTTYLYPSNTIVRSPDRERVKSIEQAYRNQGLEVTQRIERNPSQTRHNSKNLNHNSRPHVNIIV